MTSYVRMTLLDGSQVLYVDGLLDTVGEVNDRIAALLGVEDRDSAFLSSVSAQADVPGTLADVDQADADVQARRDEAEALRVQARDLMEQADEVLNRPVNRSNS